MKILFVNTKLNGGAFNFIDTHISQLNDKGHECRVIYGYGRHALKEKKSFYFEVFRTTKFPNATANFLVNRLLGKDLFAPDKSSGRSLRKMIEWSDLIHLNVIHSYAWPYKWLLEMIEESQKPVVWTAHDSWMLTGRCSVPGSCSQWKSGCFPCSNRSAYPASLFDLTNIEFSTKVDTLKSFVNRDKVALITCADWLASEFEYQGFRNVRRIHNSVNDIFFSNSQGHMRKRSSFLFVSRYLDSRIKGKTADLAEISRMLGDALTVVGDFPTSELKSTGANIIPAIADQRDLAKLFRENENLIFLSQTDYFSLTAIEALVCGMKIVGLKSPNLVELAQFGGVSIANSVEELLTIINKQEVAPVDSDYFKASRMSREYLEIYYELLEY